MDEQKWTVKLSLEELRKKAVALPKPYRKILIAGVAICDNTSLALLDGEVFKRHPWENVFVSNMGRIQSPLRTEILPQSSDPDPTKYDYLYVKLTERHLVYRLVAETWCERFDPELYNTVHHISNNGYDNRASNLMWVTKEQHSLIHNQ
jgi:hypothetical protein